LSWVGIRAALPERARAGGRVAARADAGYFAGQLARAAHDEHIFFAIGAKRIAPLWRLLDGITIAAVVPAARPAPAPGDGMPRPQPQFSR
jgi:hypothetical protein